MRVIILQTPEAVSQRAADLVCETIATEETPVLGLATGGTPVATYQELVRRYQAGNVSFSACTTFNLDEYVGLPEGHPESYRCFMNQHLFDRVDFDSRRCHLPQGNILDLQQACQAYEAMIRDSGGIDLQILGIGTDGHIAFNEPGSSLASRTRLKALTEQTRRDNSRFFESLDAVPKLSITMGIGTILEARKIVLLATGEGKADAVRALAEGPVTASVPASALQLHANVTLLLDETAASKLVRREYYMHVEEIQRSLQKAQPRGSHLGRVGSHFDRIAE